MEANIGDSSPSSLLELFFRDLGHYREKSKKFLWLQLCKDCVTSELQGLTLSARFKLTTNLTEA